MSNKEILSPYFSFVRLSIFENVVPFTIATGSSETINIGSDLINQCEIINDLGNVIPPPKLFNEYVGLSMEIEGIPDNQTSIYWKIEGISSPFNQVIDQKSTFKTGINYLHLGERLFSPNEWIGETTGFIFTLTNNGNHDIDIQRIRVNFKSYFPSINV